MLILPIWKSQKAEVKKNKFYYLDVNHDNLPDRKKKKEFDYNILGEYFKNHLNAKLEILKWSNLTILKHRHDSLGTMRKLLK